jgi:hypothetical protein
MKILRTKHIEDCFDGSAIYEILFDEPMTKAIIDNVSAGGSLQYFPEFPRPFYRIDITDHYLLKGIEGEPMMRIILKGDIRQSLKNLTERMNMWSINSDQIPSAKNDHSNIIIHKTT